MIQRVNTGASARLATKPMRQPVIAQVFDAPSLMIVRSSMPRRVASESNAPVVDEPRVDLVGEHPDLRMRGEDLGDGVEVRAVAASRRSDCAAC